MTLRSGALLLAFAMLAGCSKAPAPASAPPDKSAPATQPAGGAQPGAPLDASDDTLAGVKLGAPVAGVQAALGTAEKERFGNKSLTYWDYPSKGITVYVLPQDKTVFGVRVEKSWTGATPRGIKLGDSNARLEAAYGQPNYHGKNPMIASAHAYVSPSSRTAISFDLSNDKVTGIQLIRLSQDAQL